MKTTVNLQSGETAVLTHQEWDSRMLERSCGALTEMSEYCPVRQYQYQPLVAEFEKQKLEYVTVRRPVIEAARVQALEAVGFVQVDGIYEFFRQLSGEPEVHVGEAYKLRLALKADAEAVGELSARTFKLSRFHNDPLVTDAQADRVHREWGKNSCLGSAAQAVWILERGTHLAGFITCSIKGTTGWIGLIAVDETDSGKGLGLVLVHQSCRWFKEQNCTAVRVLTQTDNEAAIRLYTKTGFAKVATFATLRWGKEP